jgi:predicted ArsR family transcriptional regulator
MATKRKFSDLRDLILTNLDDGKKTVNQISSETGINWKTVDNHLIYLVGTGMVQVVFSSPYVKIFELTEHGKEYVEHLNSSSEKRVKIE